MQDFAVRAPSQLGTLIAGFRKARQLSQQALAAKLGSTQQAVSAFERDASPGSVERLMKTLAALDVELVLRDRRASAAAPPGRSKDRDW
jgi:HTH-type transcriptional regulator / antitoxin HipB